MADLTPPPRSNRFQIVAVELSQRTVGLGFVVASQGTVRVIGR